VLPQLSRVLLVSAAVLGFAAPARADDMDVCRDKQTEAKARLEACEKVIASGQAVAKDLAVALAVRGNAFLTKHNNDKAIEAFSAAHDADPDNPGIVDARGLAYERKGQDDLAMADYNLALQIRPNFAAAYNNRGTIYERKGALQSALDDFNASIKYAPNNFIAYTNRARILTINGDFDGALADFAAAEKIDPTARQIGSNRCLTYTAMRRFDEAIANCSSFIEKLPKWQFSLVNRGDAYMAKGSLDLALKDFNTVLTLNPNNVRAHAGTMAQERLAALTPQGPAGAITTRIALIIGNGAYKNVHPLDNPPRDARLIAGSLHDLGFQAVTLANDLGRDKFFEALHAFASEAEKADWAVVYYAGHGFEIGGVNYLVPVDARLAADKDAETEAVALEQVIAAVAGARKLRLVLLDACRDNPFAPTMQRTIALKLVDKGLSNIEPSAGFMVVYAAKHGETALDGEGTDSPFAVALAHDIKEPHIEVRKLFDIVRDDVWTATKHEQQPFTYGSPPGRDDFYFAGK
jgi:tetratricopeptide (TPR) repeat protein